MDREYNIGDIMAINTIIFDMDGLMFDTEKLYIDEVEDICRKHDHYFPREYLLGC